MPHASAAHDANVLYQGLRFSGILILAYTLFNLANRARKRHWSRHLTDLEWRTLGYIPYIALIFPAYVSPQVLALALAGVAMACLYEFMSMTRLGDCKLLLLGGPVAIFWITAFAPTYHGALPAAIVLCVVLVLVLRQEYRQIVFRLAAVTFGLLYMGWLFSLLVLLRAAPGGFAYFVYFMWLTALMDIGTYAAGKGLGRYSRRLSPEISPNKTVIGLLGGLLVTIAGGYAFQGAVPDLAPLAIFLVAGMTAMANAIGDMANSAIKRDMGVKDSSRIVPGHGGFMDRFSSWHVSAPLYYLALRLLELA